MNNSKTQKYIEHINKLNKQIKDFEYFLQIVTEYDEKSIAVKGVKVFFEKEIKVKYFLFGVRVFGYGSHQKQIEIPVTVRNDLIKVIRKRLEQLQMQLIDLINQ